MINDGSMKERKKKSRIKSLIYFSKWKAKRQLIKEKRKEVKWMEGESEIERGIDG